MNKKIWIVACLCSLQLHAETDLFDMSLYGNFSKDYCEISTTGNSVDISFDASEQEMAYALGGYEGEMAYHFHNVVTLTVDCSPGTYNVMINNTGVSARIPIGGSGVMAQNIHIFANGVSNFAPEVDSGNSASVTGISPFVDGKLADVQISLQIVPGGGVSSSLPDKINHTFQNIITIERM
tara:strand:+ start:232 stop:774 length:543 start_codon:yes stop_codon:yes gene_type:complete